jgi:hypothetical protein
MIDKLPYDNLGAVGDKPINPKAFYPTETG